MSMFIIIIIIIIILIISIIFFIFFIIIFIITVIIYCSSWLLLFVVWGYGAHAGTHRQHMLLHLPGHEKFIALSGMKLHTSLVQEKA